MLINITAKDSFDNGYAVVTVPNTIDFYMLVDKFQFFVQTSRYATCIGERINMGNVITLDFSIVNEVACNMDEFRLVFVYDNTTKYMDGSFGLEPSLKVQLYHLYVRFETGGVKTRSYDRIPVEADLTAFNMETIIHFLVNTAREYANEFAEV